MHTTIRHIAAVGASGTPGEINVDEFRGRFGLVHTRLTMGCRTAEQIDRNDDIVTAYRVVQGMADANAQRARFGEPADTVLDEGQTEDLIHAVDREKAIEICTAFGLLLCDQIADAARDDDQAARDASAESLVNRIQ